MVYRHLPLKADDRSSNNQQDRTAFTKWSSKILNGKNCNLSLDKSVEPKFPFITLYNIHFLVSCTTKTTYRHTRFPQIMKFDLQSMP